MSVIAFDPSQARTSDLQEASLSHARERSSIRRAPRLCVEFGVPTHSEDKSPIAWDNAVATNAHMCIVGPSGSGKSFRCDALTTELAKQGEAQSKAFGGRNPVRVVVVNVHGDLCQNLSPRLCQTIEFHEQSEFGLPPLEILDDPEMGGVRRRANSFIRLMMRDNALGIRQQSALYYLLEEGYRRFGFLVDDPRTWSLHFDPRPGARPGSKRYPTLTDLKESVWRRLVMMKMGQTAPAVTELTKVIKLAQKRQRFRTQIAKGGLTEEDSDKLLAQFRKAQEETIEAFKKGMDAIDRASEQAEGEGDDPGNVLRELMLWDNADAVKSLYDRLNFLERAGIFKGRDPDFDERIPVHNYDISGLTDLGEQRMFVDALLERIFIQAKRRGRADGADTFIVLDEAHLFVVSDGDHIINRIIKEGRKFGIGLVFASQNFEHFSKDLLTSASVKLILGCADEDRGPMLTKLGLEMVPLKGNPKKKANPLVFIAPQVTAMAKVVNRGVSRPMMPIKLAQVDV